MALPYTFATQPTGNVPAAYLDQNFNALGAIDCIPGVATGTNAITIALAVNTPTVSAYAQQQGYSFVAAATSTGAVTIRVGSLGFLNAYKPTTAGPTQITTGDLRQGQYYQAYYDSALNSGAGGLHVFGVAAASGGSTLLVARYYTEYTANANLTTVIPLDDTIPTSTEGTQILSVNVTTTSVTQRVRSRFMGVAAGDASNTIIWALFRGTTCIQAGNNVGGDIYAGTWQGNVGSEVEEVPGSASTFAYSVRIGGNTGTIRMNGDLTTRLFGGAQRATLGCEVYEP